MGKFTCHVRKSNPIDERAVTAQLRANPELVQQKFVEGNSVSFVHYRVSDVTGKEERVTLNLRFDIVRSWRDGDELRDARETRMCPLSIRPKDDACFYFFYGELYDAARAATRMSEILFNKARQLHLLYPTATLFDWIQQGELSQVLKGKFKITKIPGHKGTEVEGTIVPEDSEYWALFTRDGALDGLWYECSNKPRNYSIHNTSNYSAEGDGVTQEELEDYIIEVLVPHM